MDNLLVFSLGLYNVRDNVRQRPVVSDRAGQNKRHVVHYALVHHAAFQDLFLHHRLEPAGLEDLVDGLHVIAVPSYRKRAVLDPHAKRGAHKRVFNVVHRKRVACQQAVDVAHPYQ